MSLFRHLIGSSIIDSFASVRRRSKRVVAFVFDGSREFVSLTFANYSFFLELWYTWPFIWLKVVMVKSSGGIWDFPKGKNEGEETAKVALIWEVWEELSLDIKGNRIEQSPRTTFVTFITSSYLFEVNFFVYSFRALREKERTCRSSSPFTTFTFRNISLQWWQSAETELNEIEEILDAFFWRVRQKKTCHQSKVKVNSSEMEKVHNFHRHMVEEVIFLFELFDFEWDIENPREWVLNDLPVQWLVRPHWVQFILVLWISTGYGRNGRAEFLHF